MVPIPVIEVGDGEFRLNAFLLKYWYLFIFLALSLTLTLFIAYIFYSMPEVTTIISFGKIQLDLKVISISASLLVTYLGVLTILWTAFEKPVNRPIFYYFIGIEAFKRLLLVIPLSILVLVLTVWVCTLFRGALIVIFSLIGFCLGLVVFSSVLVLISRTTRIRNIIMGTMSYSLAVFFISLGLLLAVDIGSLPDFLMPFILFLYAMGVASVFFIFVTLIFEILLPLFRAT